MLKPNHISPKLVAKREYQIQQEQMEPVRAQAVPAGLIENKYSPVIGFK